MKINYNKSGTDRKALVTAMGEILEVKPKYLGTPTMSYQVDYFTVDKNGAVEFDDRADSEEIENLLERLAERGFICEPADGYGENEEISESAEAEPQDAFAVELPLNKVNVGNLTRLIEAKGSLIKKALGVDDLRFEIKDDRVAFHWFNEVDDDSAKAYTHFISALCEMSKEAKRITATERPVDNEKYAFRCFLLRLGFIGSEYKSERKILLKNLTGSSAFKDVLPDVKSPSGGTVERIRREYPTGARVELVRMDDVQAPPIGTRGTVLGVDDTGSLLMKWDNGSRLNVVYGEDIVKKL